ncbi:FlhB-like flagellar biosynthesis protein [Sulfurospirillum barnesii]|uniref:Protein containing C-terminal region of FlhB n=1 Tax=Sulfurospirillum barnesii (strain ATCC 700032 / DSM 10660 / SES-3) TaxID=760154 RepID=I3XTZ1_SULBS|nr:FlhB-like flagellar biosynthesis protein [Sulfurospirillum barnesii]AFL67415.1 protein containing C-terminal region of FlhB [Sulfurospirillum barnesii SES-3]
MSNIAPKTQKAVALKYDKEKQGAPKVVASGKGEVANNIIKLAREHDIFIKKDADLVELLSKIEINKEIPPMLYKAVAEVFSFIYKITNDKRQ